MSNIPYANVLAWLESAPYMPWNGPVCMEHGPYLDACQGCAAKQEVNVSEFKVGDRVRVRKPEHGGGAIRWCAFMDHVDGTVQTVEKAYTSCVNLVGSRWAFDTAWLTLVERDGKPVHGEMLTRVTAERDRERQSATEAIARLQEEKAAALRERDEARAEREATKKVLANECDAWMEMRRERDEARARAGEMASRLANGETKTAGGVGFSVVVPFSTWNSAPASAEWPKSPTDVRDALTTPPREGPEKIHAPPATAPRCGGIDGRACNSPERVARYKPSDSRPLDLCLDCALKLRARGDLGTAAPTLEVRRFPLVKAAAALVALAGAAVGACAWMGVVPW